MKYLPVLILSLLVLLSGCAECSMSDAADAMIEEPGAAEPEDAADAAVNKLTLEEIKEIYNNKENHCREIVNIINTDDDFALVESWSEGFSNRFWLYDLKTGEADLMPTSAEYVTLLEAVSENYIIFEASGKNSESAFTSFPYRIKCFRTGSNPGSENNFIAVHEDIYQDLSTSIEAGCETDCILYDIALTFDGMEVMFGPVDGNEGRFYASTTWIPPVSTSYDAGTNQFTFRIKADGLGDKFISGTDIYTDGHCYISSYKITQEDGVIDITVATKETAEQYSMKMKTSPLGNGIDGFPYFAVSFKGGEQTPEGR